MSAPAASGEPPLLRVVRGTPTDDELAVVVALVTSLAGRGGAPSTPEPVSGWAARDRLVRRPMHHGAGGWRASVWPR